MVTEFYFEWFTKLVKDGTIPTVDDVNTTVSSSAAWKNFDMDACLKRVKLRRLYIEHFGFPLMTKEVAEDMAKFIKSGSTVLEVCAGSGYISKCIHDANPDIKFICTDDLSWERNNENNHCYNELWKKHFMDIVEMDALKAIETYGDQADYVLLSWPEYESPLAAEVLGMCIDKGIPVIYIGEQDYGCTANEDFFSIIYHECEMDTITTNYIPFDGIHDDIYVIRKSN